MIKHLGNFIAIAMSCLALTGQVWANDPAQPANLRVAVYSDTAAELFWDRALDGESIQGYEIGVNGETAIFTDGTSYFTDSLHKGVHYEFSVTAVDDEENRSVSASVEFVGGDRNLTGGEAPLQPGNLHARVYSSSSIEILWDRVSGEALSYQISIDGAVMTQTNGTSYFSDELEAGRAYTFSVIAIDSEGNRSGAASVEAQTTGGDIDMPASGPGEPSNVRLVVYSSSAAELFWDRAAVEDRVVTTEIRRDGDIIGMAEGHSYFDPDREPGAHYVYELTTIDYRGRRSRNSVYEESPLIPIINRDNHIELLAVALATYFGDNYNALLVESLDVLLSRYLDEALSDAESYPHTHVCSNGGTAYFEVSAYTILFTDCQIEDAVYDGDYAIQVGNANWVSSEGLTISHLSTGQLQFDGTIQIAARDFHMASEVNAALNGSTDSLLLAAVNTVFSFTHRLRCCSGSPNFLAQFSGSFDFIAQPDDDETISVATLSDFNYSEPMETHDENWNYQTGVLQLVSTDGSELILDADSGDDSTVSIRISNADGVEAFMQPWSLWENVLRRSP